MNETFDKLNTEFNTSAISDCPSQEIQTFEQQRKEIIEKTNNIKTLEDKEYLQSEIKSLIDNSKRVLEIIQKDIKIGSPPRMAEVYAKLLSSTLEGIRELREVNTVIANMKVFNDPIETTPKANINIKMTAKELMSLMKEAKEGSQIRAVEATFKTEGEPKDGTREDN